MKYYKNLKRALSNTKEDSKNKDKTKKEDLDKLKDDLESKLKKLGERVQKEKKLNENLINECKEKVITYGTEVQLMHFDSKHFIKSRKMVIGQSMYISIASQDFAMVADYSFELHSLRRL